MKRAMTAVLAVISALALGAACEQNSSRPGNAERGGSSSMPTARGPSGDTASRANDTQPGSAGMASGSSASSNDMSGTGGAGDAGMGRDAGMR